MSTQSFFQTGQQQARAYWGTQESGAAFDRKKTPYLTQQAQAFITQQAMCVLTGLTIQNTLDGLLILERPGFLQVLDASTCLLQLHNLDRFASILQRLQYALTMRQEAWLCLFFICHPTRERLCVHVTVEALFNTFTEHNSSPMLVLRLHVQEAFFHCSKYIRTRVPGLTAPGSPLSPQEHEASLQRLKKSQQALTEEHRHFLDQQTLSYLCTVNRQGRCALNHRAGAAGFLVSYLPTPDVPGGILLLPDYAGNGAFEAIGNILETKQVALIVPSYTEQIAICVSGIACIMEMTEVHPEVAQCCHGAERLLAIAVQHVEVQSGDWSLSLSYEHDLAEALSPTEKYTACVLA